MVKRALSSGQPHEPREPEFALCTAVLCVSPCGCTDLSI